MPEEAFGIPVSRHGHAAAVVKRDHPTVQGASRARSRASQSRCMATPRTWLRVRRRRRAPVPQVPVDARTSRTRSVIVARRECRASCSRPASSGPTAPARETRAVVQVVRLAGRRTRRPWLGRRRVRRAPPPVSGHGISRRETTDAGKHLSIDYRRTSGVHRQDHRPCQPPRCDVRRIPPCAHGPGDEEGGRANGRQDGQHDEPSRRETGQAAGGSARAVHDGRVHVSAGTGARHGAAGGTRSRSGTDIIKRDMLLCSIQCEIRPIAMRVVT